MVERTPGDFAPTDDTSGSEGDFWTRLERILKKPQVQQRLLAEAPEEVQHAVMSEFSDTDTQTDAPTDVQETTETADDVTPEKLAALLEEIEDQVGGGYTVTQLRQFTETNPEMVDGLLDEYL